MEQLINSIIRPPRAEYNPKNDLLDQEFMLKGKWYQRKDLEVVNSRGDVLQCSHYVPRICPDGHKLPCVIYCHGNSGCRMDANEAAVILLPLNITVFTLDFSGSGLSGGEYVTLGWNEKDDLRAAVEYLRSDGNVSLIGLWGRSMGAVTSLMYGAEDPSIAGTGWNEKDDLRAAVEYLRSDGNVSLIGLWGRSMGAVTSLMYGAEDPSIAGMVLDSPFSDLVDLMMELVDTFKVRLPRFTLKFAIQYMRRAIQKKAKFDIMNLNTIKIAKCCFVPVLFGHATDDDFIQPNHSDRIFDAYVGDKNIIKFAGDHNSPRPHFYFDSISIFFNNVLQPPEDEVGSTYYDSTHEYFSKGKWSIFHDLDLDLDLDLSDELLSSPIAASSNEDVVKQLHSKRPILVPPDVSSEDNQLDSLVLSSPSSSNMISFELSKYGSHVPPRLIDDDEYIEYPLDTSAEVPTNIEEERLFMEAMRESLKDSEAKCPIEQPHSVGESPCIELSKEELKHKEEGSFSLSHMLPVDSDKLISETSPKSLQPEVEESGNTSHNQMSDLDMAKRIRVIIKVEKKQTNIIDGLLRRWDFKFFRNR